MRRLRRFTKKEEIHWRQRSRKKWIKESDTNTSFFHKVTNIRRWVNTIHSISVDGGRVEDTMQIHNHIHRHFRNLFGTRSGMKLSFVGDNWDRV